MKPACSLLLAVAAAVFAACEDPPATYVDGAMPDAEVGADGETSVDAAPDASPSADAADGDAADVDAAEADAAAVDAAPFDCYSSNGPHVLGVGGGGALIVELTLDVTAAETDGIYGAITGGLLVDDVAVVAVAGKLASGDGSIWHLSDPEVLGAPMTPTLLGAAPGVSALAYASNANLGLYGAAGLTVVKITPAPYAVATLGTIDAPDDCTGIADFAVSSSGDSPYFQVVLDCAGGDQYTTMSYIEGVGFSEVQAPAPTGVELAGFSFGSFATDADTLYRLGLDGVFAEIRPLSACIGAVRGID